jgi:hypothetical protein
VFDNGMLRNKVSLEREREREREKITGGWRKLLS